MKRLVICCDGTWKGLDSVRPTNVCKLAQAVLPQAPGSVAQVCCHLDGVGTGRGTGRIARGLDRLFGGLFGQGLMATVEDAYRFLVFNHAPGDEIFLFGFSRGAFTARTLAGLIRTCGILERSQAAAIPAALALYKARGHGAHPDRALALAFRARHAPHMVTSATEARVRGPVGAPLLRLAYLGVWDTVGALGVPSHLRLAGLLNRSVAFHDTALSRIVAGARHAVAIDETRRTFPPTLWDNLTALNGGARGREAPYQQQWFPGDHGSVGGGGAVEGLAHDALLWVAEGAVGAGLALDPAALAAWSAGRDCLAPLTSRGAVRSPLLDRAIALGSRHRAGPPHPGDISEAALQRWRRDPSYRPTPLRRLAGVMRSI